MVEQLGTVAEGAAQRATATPEALAETKDVQSCFATRWAE
ncbi:hypothetical protein SCE1572_06810 [Sorangium cellulosum So0157-2]|uniref:Uncharacterized protein n=1 Tax=Sorangium cellulosum So0157-2 TaxID=1254432 RepID=S4XUE9_SORCE|nr:hypothetical protein SCE1572_06810 [Sorangium cellulosum So0157-2]